MITLCQSCTFIHIADHIYNRWTNPLPHPCLSVWSISSHLSIWPSPKSATVVIKGHWGYSRNTDLLQIAPCNLHWHLNWKLFRRSGASQLGGRVQYSLDKHCNTIALPCCCCASYCNISICSLPTSIPIRLRSPARLTWKLVQISSCHLPQPPMVTTCLCTT